MNVGPRKLDVVRVFDPHATSVGVAHARDVGSQLRKAFSINLLWVVPDVFGDAVLDDVVVFIHELHSLGGGQRDVIYLAVNIQVAKSDVG